MQNEILEPIGQIQPVCHDNTYFDEIGKTWNGNPCIFSKLDYFSCIVKNVTVVEVFKSLHLEEFYKDFLHAFFESIDIVAEPQAVLVMHKYNGIKIKIPYASYMRSMQCWTVDDIKVEYDHKYSLFQSIIFDTIKIDISGQGLDFLRSYNIDIDQIIYNRLQFDLDVPYHETRVDFAFDLIDYHGEFYNELIRDCMQYTDPDTLRVSTNSKGAISWSGRVGGERTVYLGSKNADKMLRVYDKKHQFIIAKQWPVKCPYKNGDQIPSTWIRIELQTRRKEAQKLIASKLPPEQLLKYIYDNYALRSVHTEPSGRRLAGDTLPSWVELFQWHKIVALLAEADDQNANFVQFSNTQKSTYTVAHKNLKHELMVRQNLKSGEYEEMLNSSLYFYYVNKPQKYNDVVQYLFSEPSDHTSLYKDHNGVWQIVDRVSDELLKVYGHTNLDGSFTPSYFINTSTGQLITDERYFYVD